ncbi:PAS domain-containing protein [Ferrovibrio sp.]|uniref:PAS domain-containing protein n=1 Tax=Ferrovibrio sp. TaxID=1917215 RepID=UPI00351600ED
MIATTNDNGQLTWSPAPEACRHAVIADLYRYWLGRQAETGRLPARADFDPLTMRKALGNVALIEVHRDPLRFRIRLAGTNQASRLDRDPTGQWLDEMDAPEYRMLLIGRLTAIVRDPAPLLVHNRQLLDERWYDYEVIWLPLANDGRTVDMVMACQIFADATPTD